MACVCLYVYECVLLVNWVYVLLRFLLELFFLPMYKWLSLRRGHFHGVRELINNANIEASVIETLGMQYFIVTQVNGKLNS